MRVIYATLVLGGVLLLATASLRFDAIQIKPRNGQPYIVQKIVWPWERNDTCVLQADGSYKRTRFSLWGAAHRDDIWWKRIFSWAPGRMWRADSGPCCRTTRCSGLAIKSVVMESPRLRAADRHRSPSAS